MFLWHMPVYRIEYLPSGVFTGLRSISKLTLHGNRLTTLQWTVFSPGDFIGGHPARLVLGEFSIIDTFQMH